MIGRSVRLDIYTVDTVEKKYNIEVQRVDKGAAAKRRNCKICRSYFGTGRRTGKKSVCAIIVSKAFKSYVCLLFII